MCGILFQLYGSYAEKVADDVLEEATSLLEQRGPEGSARIDVSGAVFYFTRLAINGLNEKGMQPFQDNTYVWMCNGEIYNSPQLQKRLSYTPISGSDCEVLSTLLDSCEGDYVAFARALDGVFALIMYNKETGETIVMRDPYGVRPLYVSYDTDMSMQGFDLPSSMQNNGLDRPMNGIGRPMSVLDRPTNGIDRIGWMFASERKSLEYAGCKAIIEFPPGEIWTIDKDGYQTDRVVYHTTPWIHSNQSYPTLLTSVRESLIASVEKRLFTERPIAALLSGGVDSSLICAILQSLLKKAGKPPLKTFSIGMKGGTDLEYARKVAEWIGSDHTEILTTADEMFSVIPEVIRDIESYDVTTIRASVGNWMVAREIAKQTDCKVVFNGDGSDEVWGSYLYFYKAPSDDAFERESEKLLELIHRYDVLRSDRCISSHGLEARTPFLDKQFVALARSFPLVYRRPMKGVRVEKQSLREAFDETGLLPKEVLWRKKEAFSDGVSATEKSWYQEIQERIEDQRLVPQGWEEIAKEMVPPPMTPEAFWYRTMFEELYPHTADPWPYWMPAWSPETTDPSARTLV